MLYYVCDSDKPMDVPWGGAVKFYDTEAQAVAAVNNRASDNPGRTSYVHAFPSSVVIVRALGTVTTETEIL
jgi:hypothetical protein